MKCPKCEGQLKDIVIEGVGVARCVNCQGLWFDILGMENLARKKAAARLDVGPLDLGGKYNKLRDIDCPKCGTRMTKMSDKDIPELQYEKCPICYGVWLDAGKFRLYRQRGWFSSLKRLFSRSSTPANQDDLF
jgi:Zn-finger nucleic acid-binding protein